LTAVPSPPLALAVLGHGVVDPGRPWLHADDQAVLRGRAAFETMRVYGGRPFRLDRHLERLAGSADVIDLPPPDLDRLAALAAEAVAAAGVPEAALRVVWTAGRESEERGTGFALVTALPGGLERLRTEGIELASLQLAIGAHLRTDAPWLLPGAKSTSYAVNMAAQREARRRGADDALFLSLEGLVLEGPVSNVWFREGDRLGTPSLHLGILAGVTRDTLLSAAANLDLAVEEGEYRLDRLLAADEVFTSSSVREVVPAVRIDGREVGDGRPGPAAARLQAALRAAAGFS
jgi:4-amino-4-deoxychorismate lyase